MFIVNGISIMCQSVKSVRGYVQDNLLCDEGKGGQLFVGTFGEETTVTLAITRAGTSCS